MPRIQENLFTAGVPPRMRLWLLAALFLNRWGSTPYVPELSVLSRDLWWELPARIFESIIYPSTGYGAP